MQPYFFPYFGYFQLIAAVDLFVVYDNIKYTKKGWINRNRILRDGRDIMFSLPLKNDSDHLNVDQREIAANFDREKLLNQIKEAYRRAPFFEQTLPLIERAVRHNNANLFDFLHHALIQTCGHLGITTEIRTSSTISIDHTLRGQDKVLALCKAVGTKVYVNAVGGQELYSKVAFGENGIELRFLKSNPFEYPQFGAPFVPWLSIIDVMMFNPSEVIRDLISRRYELI